MRWSFPIYLILIFLSCSIRAWKVSGRGSQGRLDTALALLPARSTEAWKFEGGRIGVILASALLPATLLTYPHNALAIADCKKDCVKNCIRVAPGSKGYCEESCTDYCAQDDRTDGLSGSISNTGGETGIFGGSPVEGGASVIQGEDRPPQLLKIIPEGMIEPIKVRSN